MFVFLFKRRERRRRIIDAIVKPCLPFSLLSLSLGFWLSLSLSLLIPFYLSHPSQWLTTTTTSPWQISLPVRISFLSHLILFFSSFLPFSQSSFFISLCVALNEENRADLVNALKVSQSLKYENFLFSFCFCQFEEWLDSFVCVAGTQVLWLGFGVWVIG